MNGEVIHDIALTAAKIFVKSNLPEYKESGYFALVSDLLSSYTEACKQISKEYPN